jgi:hypothetical protein
MTGTSLNEPCATCVGRKGTPLNIQKNSPMVAAVNSNLDAGIDLYCHEPCCFGNRVCASFARAKAARERDPNFRLRTIEDITYV